MSEGLKAEARNNFQIARRENNKLKLLPVAVALYSRAMANTGDLNEKLFHTPFHRIWFTNECEVITDEQELQRLKQLWDSNAT